MLQFETAPNCDSIEIFLDEKGIDELIQYLFYIKKDVVTFHLTAGNELDETELFDSNNKLVKHIKFVYLPALEQSENEKNE